jgi:myo-inositol-1(or 4)-monophosphatase
VAIKYSIDELSSFALEAIQNTGKEALAFYQKGPSKVKFNETLVTEAELHLNSHFQKALRDTYPDHNTFQDRQLEEEYSHDEKRYLWIFDPIDGVDNFQAGIPIWGMSLALLENFWPVLGIFYMPVTDDLFHAQAGKKAYWGKQQIGVTSQQSVDDESLLLTFSRFHQYYDSGFPGKIRDMGSIGAHVCYVAMGRADAAVTANESYKDLAAVRVIIEAAGGKIGKVGGGDFYLNDYLDGRKITDHLVVASPDNHSQVLQHLTKRS